MSTIHRLHLYSASKSATIDFDQQTAFRTLFHIPAGKHPWLSNAQGKPDIALPRHAGDRRISSIQTSPLCRPAWSFPPQISVGRCQRSSYPNLSIARQRRFHQWRKFSIKPHGTLLYLSHAYKPFRTPPRSIQMIHLLWLSCTAATQILLAYARLRLAADCYSLLRRKYSDLHKSI